jgi:hypothetical protein
MVLCYYKKEDQVIREINSGLCLGSGSAAGYFSCCFPWDKCLPNALCYSTNATAYYTALCTDQSVQDSACQKGCSTDFPSPAFPIRTDHEIPADYFRGGVYGDVSYNSSSNAWACCKGDTSCSRSTETFEAPAPDLLLQQTHTIVDFIPTSTSSSPASITTSPTGSTSKPSIGDQPSSSTNSATKLNSRDVCFIHSDRRCSAKQQLIPKRRRESRYWRRRGARSTRDNSSDCSGISQQENAQNT